MSCGLGEVMSAEAARRRESSVSFTRKIYFDLFGVTSRHFDGVPAPQQTSQHEEKVSLQGRCCGSVRGQPGCGGFRVTVETGEGSRFAVQVDGGPLGESLAKVRLSSLLRWMTRSGPRSPLLLQLGVNRRCPADHQRTNDTH